MTSLRDDRRHAADGARPRRRRRADRAAGPRRRSAGWRWRRSRRCSCCRRCSRSCKAAHIGARHRSIPTTQKAARSTRRRRPPHSPDLPSHENPTRTPHQPSPALCRTALCALIGLGALAGCGAAETKAASSAPPPQPMTVTRRCRSAARSPAASRCRPSASWRIRRRRSTPRSPAI